MASLVGGSETTTTGTWKGLSNHIAPRKGEIAITGTRGKSATCTVSGQTKGENGDGWVFRGDASVEQISCEGRIEKSGSVSLDLQLKMEWRGRIKGIGGDWEDTDGEATCEGELQGTLTEGGRWSAKCKRDDKEWETELQWNLDEG